MKHQKVKLLAHRVGVMYYFIALFLFHFILYDLATGQVNTGEIEGSITNADQKPAAFAQVMVQRNDSLVRGTFTDGDGNFKINQLSPGDYDIKVSLEGNEEIMMSKISVYPDNTTPIEIIMKPQEQQDQNQTDQPMEKTGHIVLRILADIVTLFSR